MAEEPETSGSEPNLELPPLLGFRRKKGRKAPADPGDPATAELPPVEAPAEETEPLAADPVAPPARETASEPGGPLAPSATAVKRPPPVPPPSRPSVIEEPAVEEPAVEEPAPAVPPPPVEPSLAGADTTSQDEPDVVAESVSGPVSGPATEQTTVLPSQPLASEPAISAPPVADPPPITEPPVLEPPVAAPPVSGPLFADEVAEAGTAPESAPEFEPDYTPAAAPVPGPAAAVSPDAAEPPPAPVATARRTPSIRVPVINPRLAAALTGAVIGLVGVVLAFAAGRGCEAVRGVGSCGGLGLLALLVILAIEVVLGAVLLALWRISDPTSTSFLGVGVAAVFVLLFLLSSLDSVWMFLVLPLVTALTYLLSLWVTDTFVDGPDSI